MNRDDRFLQALRTGIRGGQVDWDEEISVQDWNGLFRLAQRHHVQPLVVDSVYSCAAFLNQPEAWRRQLKQAAARQMAAQTLRTTAFLELYSGMREAGLHPLVMKGLVCRELYPVPDARPSSDEDLLIPEEEFVRGTAFLRERGFEPLEPGADPQRSFELGFQRRDGSYIELHKTPFAPDSSALGDLNRLFEHVHEHPQAFLQGDTVLETMDPHDHMLYLLLHAYKHVIHSGFGVRQICDMVLWAERYGGRIDWERLRVQCGQARGWRFSSAVFVIGRERLGFDLKKAGLPEDLLARDTPWEELLSDLLEGGVYGGADLSRKHSAAITLGRVESDRSGRRYSLHRVLFPGRKSLAGRYPYLNRFPALLPLAWCQRGLKYAGELWKKPEESRASESVRIGRERAELLRKLDIMD